MLQQAFWSIVAGLTLSALAFVPVVVWQFRRYGAFSRRRLLATVITFIYVSAVVAYTLFPVPRTLTPEFCAARGRPIVLDPTLYFRQMPAELAGLSLVEALRSWVVLQMVLNVALFVPLGVLGIRAFHWSRWRTVLTGLAASVLVEATQYTGNWFLMPCSYRLADVNDLLTNTLGTAVGVGVGLLLPRLIADPAELARHRDESRPVTRGRRWAAMLVDAWLLLVILTVIWAVVMIVMAVILGNRQLDPGGTHLVNDALLVSTIVTVLLCGALPWLLLRGGSLGQRALYLRTVPRPGGWRWWHPGTLRALAVLSLATNLALPGWLAWLYLLVDACWVAKDVRGLSGVITRHDIVDARALPLSEVAAGDKTERSPMAHQFPEEPPRDRVGG